MIIAQTPTAQLEEARRLLADHLATRPNARVAQTLRIKIRAIDTTIREREGTDR